VCPSVCAEALGCRLTSMQEAATTSSSRSSSSSSTTLQICHRQVTTSSRGVAGPGQTGSSSSTRGLAQDQLSGSRLGPKQGRTTLWMSFIMAGLQLSDIVAPAAKPYSMQWLPEAWFSHGMVHVSGNGCLGMVATASCSLPCTVAVQPHSGP